jgi:hypothetical protein
MDLREIGCEDGRMITLLRIMPNVGFVNSDVEPSGFVTRKLVRKLYTLSFKQ